MTENTLQKVFLGFAILTIISGIYLIYMQDYLIGISGSIVGVFLVYLNRQKHNTDLKDKES